MADSFVGEASSCRFLIIGGDRTVVGETEMFDGVLRLMGGSVGEVLSAVELDVPKPMVTCARRSGSATWRIFPISFSLQLFLFDSPFFRYSIFSFAIRITGNLSAILISLFLCFEVCYGFINNFDGSLT